MRINSILFNISILLTALLFTTNADAVQYCNRYSTNTAIACYGPDYPPPSGGSGTVGIGTINLAAVYVGINTVGPAANLYIVGNNVGVGTSHPNVTLDVVGQVRPSTGILFGDGTTQVTAATSTTFANPTASVGLVAVNGIATTAMRSDAAPALDQTIIPTWTGLHTFNKSGISLITAANLGVGTTTPPNALYVAGTAEMQGFKMNNAPGAGYLLTSNAIGIGTWTPPGSSGGGTPGGNTTEAQYNSAGTFAGLPRSVMTSGGNFGIGTTVAPSGTVDISKNSTDDPFMVSSSASGNGDYLIVRSSGNVGMGTTTANAKLQILGNIGIGTMSADSYLLTSPPNGGIIAYGNVGFGTWNPSSALSVSGSGNATIILNANPNAVGGCDSNTQFLAHLDSAFTDSNCDGSGAKTITANGGASISATAKFGAGSAALVSASSQSFTINDFTWANGTNPWEIDLQLRLTTDADFDIVNQRVSGNDTCQIRYVAASHWVEMFYTQGGVSVLDFHFPWTPSTGTFNSNHIQIGRDSSNFYGFVAGVKQTVTYVTGSGTTSLNDLAANIDIGGRVPVGDLFLNGFVDEARISSVVRNTATYTDTTAAYDTGDPTTSPKLQLKGNNNNLWSIYNDGSVNNFLRIENGTPQFNIDNNGNVGVGTSMTGNLAKFAVIGGNVGIGTILPGKVLDVVGDIRTTSATGGHLFGTDGTASIIASAQTSSDLIFNTAAVERMRIANSGGNVGIGTTTPPSLLYVAGTARSQALKIDNIQGATQCLHVDSSGNVTGTGSDCTSVAGSNFWINTANVGIGTAYNVGIGTTNPLTALSVYGNIGINTITAQNQLEVNGIVRISSPESSSSRTALVMDGGFGNTSGNARGLNAIDIQTGRNSATLVANGGNAVAFGFRNSATQSNAVSLGNSDLVTGTSGSGVGVSNTCSNGNCNAFGRNNTASGTSGSQAFGDTCVASGTLTGCYGYSSTASGNNTFVFGANITNPVVGSLMIGPAQASRLTIDTTGNVGIGTHIPVAKLSIAGNIAVGLGTSYMTIAPPLNGAIVQGNVGIATWQANNSLIIASGNVGIGSLSPGSALDIFGKTRITGSGHSVSTGTAPTVASNDCGSTSQGTITALSTDNSGSVVVGTVAPTSCAVTFANSWAVAPNCIITDDTSVLALKASATTTKLTIGASISIQGDTISWICQGNE